MILEQQNNKNVYSDGFEVERRMLEIAKKYPEDRAQEYIAQCYDYTTNNTFSSVRQNLLNWYDFRSDASVLEIGAGMGALTGLLCDKCARVTAVEMSSLRAEVIQARYPERKNLHIVVGDINHINLEEQYDYVVFVGVLEYAAIFSDSENPFLEFIRVAASFMKPNGRLLFAIENQYGLKYWCGAAEDHLQIPFLGIDGYRDPKTARTFSKAALEEILDNAGLTYKRFYGTMPDYKFPTLLYTEDWKPSGSDLKKLAYTYGANSCLVTDERDIYQDLADNNVQMFFANSFFVEASALPLEKEYPFLVTARGESRPEYRILTKLNSNGTLSKQAAHPAAEKHLRQVDQNEKRLVDRGVRVLTSEISADGTMIRPLSDLPRADERFRACLETGNLNGVWTLVEQLREALLKSSELSKNKNVNALVREGIASEKEDFGVVLCHGYIDMAFYNAFLDEDELVFFDQEWCVPDLPIEFILYYAVKSAFQRGGVNSKVSLESVFEHLGIKKERWQAYDQMEEAVWKNVLLRQGDFYGEGGYCTQYHNTPKFSEVISALKSKTMELDKLRSELICREGHIELLLQSERDLQAKLEEKDRVYHQLKEESECRYLQAVEEKAQACRKLEEEKAQACRKLEEEKAQACRKLEEEKAQACRKLKEENAAEVAKLEQIIRNKEGHIELLLESDRELEHVKNSRAWRVMKIVWKTRALILPPSSKRVLLAKMLLMFFKRPVLFLKKCSPSRIKRFLSVLKREGVASTIHRVDEYQLENRLLQTELRIETADEKSVKTIEDYGVLRVPEQEEPLVSIVIPVYNQFDYTYLCVKSILEHSDDVCYEILIADDCSTDLTARIDEIIRGLHTIHNKENLRFLRNCNNAAKQARGTYLLFLNNDTQVQENWLEPLVSLIESAPDVGMVGSKLVYPDGRLQEAGGILWKDGSAWNYGNRSNPDAPEYNYVKEVDYISGASIMIRRALWEEIGGFDDRFAPAYCEDSDLAFEVRKHGYRVLYQPKSVVVHFEGVSNGTDTSSGQKAYQVVNQQKFFEKWKDVLEKEHNPNGENAFLARERGIGKKVLLMVDHYVPHFDKDAGSRTVYQYLRLFIDQGYHVKFIGDNFYPHQPYTEVLQQLGIEVLYGPYYASHWKDWLKENGKSIHYAFLNRPHIAANYIDQVRQYTPACIVYYGHDLHFMRELREYELTGDAGLLKSAEDWKQKELALMRKADMAYYPSVVEESEINRIAPDVRVKAIPAYLFTDVEDQPYVAEDRIDLMFIGGFGHRPNVDAVKWLAQEVMPKLETLLPNVVVHILGSNPPQEVLSLATEHLRIEGFVTDEELAEYYHTCKMAIVPLRYGAGIKGKVVEAMRYGIPVVTTHTGAEGIVGAEEILVIVDESQEFAEKIAEFYQKPEELVRRSTASLQYIRDHFSPDNARKVIGPEFDMN